MKLNLRGIFMKEGYPIIMTKDADFYVVSIPDFQIGTQRETLAEAMEMARDAIGMCGCHMQDEKRIFQCPLPWKVLLKTLWIF